jgi:hypothetical protein
MYSALVPTSASRVSTETPVHSVSSLDHLVTQWMSTVICSLGSEVSSSQVHETGSSTAPLIVKLHPRACAASAPPRGPEVR